MYKPMPLVGVAIAIGVALWVVIFAQNDSKPAPMPEATSTPQEVYECNADAKICPDGSSVGRTGPNCEFAACPSPDATAGTVTTYLGGSPTTLNVTINPKQVVSDSRCPEGVQCIWAGTVEVRTVLSTQVSHGEHILKIGTPQRFGDYTVTLTEVTPYPNAEETIPESSYRFTYEVKKN
jgi:hypothetical protein